MTSSDTLEILGFHTDGRVRNPVPTKLQGMTNNRNGNFAVMHIDLSGTKPSDRNAAAKRTSEETEARAKRANKSGWQPVRRSRSAWHNNELDSQKTMVPDATTPGSRTAATAKASVPVTAPSTDSQNSECSQPRLPVPLETKAVQARLLTLLRTLHPILVVDQLCKALAFFGGIPGAPPPPNGVFPSSATNNGPGSLLVSWLAEIFPPVDDPVAVARNLRLPPFPSAEAKTGQDRQQANAVPVAPSEPVRRARGRPKESKSSKVRKDKGMKKSRPPLQTDSVSGTGDAIQPKPIGGQNGTHSIIVAAGTTGQASTAPTLAHSLVSLGDQVNPDMPTLAKPAAKKRGRPKGSKNKPKDMPVTTLKASSDQAISIPAVQAMASKSPTSGPANMPSGASVTPGDVLSGPVLTPISSESTPRNVAPLPVTGTDAASRSDRDLISVYPEPSDCDPTSTFQGSFPGRAPSRVEQDGRHRTNLIPSATARPATKKRPASFDSSLAPAGAATNGYVSTQALGTAFSDQLAKRRRVSKDVAQPPAVVEAQSLSPDVTTSPALNRSLGSASPQLSASKSPGSLLANNNRAPRATMGTSLGLQQQRHHPLHHQQASQPQRAYQHQMQHSSAEMGTADQESHGAMQTSGSPRAESQKMGPYSAQRNVRLSPQMNFSAQQQQQPHLSVSSPAGSQHHPNASLSPGMARGSQYAQVTMRPDSGPGGASGLAPQRDADAGKCPRPRGRPGRSLGLGSHPPRRQATSQPTAMGSFQSANEQSYLNMDYGLTERDVQDAAAVTALEYSSQPEAGSARSKARDQHVFQSIGRR